jgi:hypothetical protein
MNLRLSILFGLFSLVFSMRVLAGPYPAGVHEWRNSEGKLILMSGIMTDNAVQVYLNYSFYFETLKNKTLYQIPLIDGGDQSKYRLTVTESSNGDAAFEDALLVQRGKEVWLLVGEQEGDSGAELSAEVTVRTYKLVAGGDGDWAYYFKLIKSERHSGSKSYTVEKALNDNANALK